MYYNCPTCQGPADNVDSHTAMAVCIYCGEGFAIDDETSIALGTMALATDDESPLYTGATGTIEDRRFVISGRLRFEFSGGHSNEWSLYLEDSDEFAWLTESEGEFHLKEESSKAETIPDYNELELDARFEIAGSIVMVTEKNKAILEGAEGSIPLVVKKDTAIPFIQASFDNNAVTIDYNGENPTVSITRYIDLSDIHLDVLKADLEEEDHDEEE